MTDQEVVITDVPLAEKPNKDLPPLPEPAAKEPLKAEGEVPDAAAETEVLKPAGDEKVVADADSFKEESTKLADLSDSEKKALEEFKQLIQEALNKHEFTAQPTPPPPSSLPVKVEESPSEAVVEKTDETVDDAQKRSDEEQEPPKAEAKIAEANEGEAEKEEKSKETTPPAAEEVVVAVQTESLVDEDGAKTVEAIEETIVAVAASAAAPSEEAVDTTANPPPTAVAPEEVSIWGIPLMADERTDVVLLKFLRARDFKVKESFAMIKNTIQWRKDFKIDELLEEDLGSDLEKVAFMHGSDKEGHPVCYNVYGEFQNRELYQKTFSDEEKREKFLRWRIQFLEKGIRKMDFNPGGISTMVHVNDLKNSPGLGKWELRQATKHALQIFQDNYPEFVAKQVFINVPWWYLAVNRMMSPFLTHRTKSKFVFAGPSKSAETLLRYITAQELPVKYGGMSKDGEFETCDSVTEITVKPSAKHTVEYPVTQACVVTWEVRVVGWDVSYGAEYVPSGEGSYTVIIDKARKVASSSQDHPVLTNTFKISEAGKVVLSIDNPTNKKKKLLYRFKTKSL
ncbi:patellin-3-like [Cucurbita maxima]|uniref:Patellin-3-like n=1 Tax=Cucurbita maxima TaxID=3661 RepID=A0A6J1HRN9_CUCMA|nr:patellin-3-like [Cucurbita maxima]